MAAAALAGIVAVASVQAQEAANSQTPVTTSAPLLQEVSDTTRPPLADLSQTGVAQTHFGQTHFEQTDDALVVVARARCARQSSAGPWFAKAGSFRRLPGRQVLPARRSAAPNRCFNSNSPDQDYGKQNKRILWVIPNYRAVSANSHLPPLNFKSELWLATQDTFDYSGFIFVGALSGLDMASKSQPTFGQGAQGYGKYYWHVFVDSGVENYLAEAIIPAATGEDPRYYTMGRGGFFKRTGYALDRLFITRTNSGKNTFNLSEVVGAGAAAGIGNAYYPAEANPWVKTYQRWGTQVGLDGVFNVVKEFWPDINRAVFRGRY